jgi:hypothetical protein
MTQTGASALWLGAEIKNFAQAFGLENTDG